MCPWMSDIWMSWTNNRFDTQSTKYGSILPIAMSMAGCDSSAPRNILIIKLSVECDFLLCVRRNTMFVFIENLEIAHVSMITTNKSNPKSNMPKWKRTQTTTHKAVVAFWWSAHNCQIIRTTVTFYWIYLLRLKQREKNREKSFFRKRSSERKPLVMVAY